MQPVYDLSSISDGALSVTEGSDIALAKGKAVVGIDRYFNGSTEAFGLGLNIRCLAFNHIN